MYRHIYIYMYIFIHIYIYTYIFIYIFEAQEVLTIIIPSCAMVVGMQGYEHSHSLLLECHL